MSSKREYFPNNWQEYKDAEDSDFIPHTFEEIMSWKVAGWELPSSVCCVIRATDLETKKVKEFIYQKPGNAQRKVNELMANPKIEFTVCEHDAIHHLIPHEIHD